jgi:hypothetical protein
MGFNDSSSKSDDASNDASAISDMSFAEDLCIVSLALSFRADRLVVARMNWHRHVQSLLHENLFHIKYRMSIESFNRLLDLLSPKLHLKDKYAIISGSEPISCEIMLHCAIRFLAGGSYHDIRATAFISKPSFFRLVWHTIDAINSCDAFDVNLPRMDELPSLRAGFKKISYSGVMDGCVGALDGYLMRITAPSHSECGNVGAYFSGHYCTYGVNIQAMCDAYGRFRFFCLAAPGKTNDSVTIKKNSRPAWLGSLPPGFFIVTDCAYSISEHSIAPYSGPQ